MIQNIYKKITESKLPWLLFYLGFTIELGMVIVDKSSYTNPIEGYLFRITFLLFAGKVLLTRCNWKEWLVIALFEAVGFLSYRITGENDIIRIVTFVAACKNIPLKQMMRYAFWVTAVGCMGIILLSVTGIYGAMSLSQDFGRGVSAYEIYDGAMGMVETRYTLGMGHPNALSCMFLMVCVMGVYAYFEQLKWYGYLFLLFLNVGVFWLTDSKTSMLITTAFLVGACVMKYARRLQERNYVYLLGGLIFLLCVGFSVDAAASAVNVRQAEWSRHYGQAYEESLNTRLLVAVDEKINGRIVSLTNSEHNDGAIESWTAFSNENNMTYYFDMGWVKLFYRYGVIPGILYVAVSLFLLWRLWKKKDACGLVVFVIMAVYTVLEAHLVSDYIGRNFMLLLIAYYGWTFSSENGILN